MALASLLAPTLGHGAVATKTLAMMVIADRDDDDVDGQADSIQTNLTPAARIDLAPVPPPIVGGLLRVVSGGEHVRLIVRGSPVAWAAENGAVTVPPGAMLQGVSSGVFQGVLSINGGAIDFRVEVFGASMRDGDRHDVDFANHHASLNRTPPSLPPESFDARYDDPDALRVLIELPRTEMFESIHPNITLQSVSASGATIDTLNDLPFRPVTCSSAPVDCFATAPIRFVVDDVDRTHPVANARSIRGEVGGAIVVRSGGRKLQAIRVMGPRDSAIGPIGLYQATIRPFVFRALPGSAPAIGGNDLGAAALVRSELITASTIWNECGIALGDPRAIEVRVVDPPPPYLLAIGDGLGLPASGGTIRFRVNGHLITTTTRPGSSVDLVAYEVARAIERAGFATTISPNARISPGYAGSVDVLVRARNGAFAVLEPDANGAYEVSSDPTLSARIGNVDLTDGLQHFQDMDSMAGTIEERTLLKSIDDGDPRTVEIVVLPSFAGGARIGESFIGSDSSSLHNIVLLDRAGVRARKSSLTLAHELGHVLLNDPGHPDDFGIDTPTLLMDSDAADSSPFGPRRLTIDECARAIRQSGPRARLPLLSQTRLTRLAY